MFLVPAPCSHRRTAPMTLRHSPRPFFFCAAFSALISSSVFADTADTIREYEKDARGLSAASVSTRAAEPPVSARTAWQSFQKRHEGWTATWDMATGTPVRSLGPAISLGTRPTTSTQAADV